MSLKPLRFPNIFRSRRSPASSVSTQSPVAINVPVNHQKTRDMGETAIQAVKESLKVVVSISTTFPPLQSAAAGLVEIFDRIDVSLLSSNSVSIMSKRVLQAIKNVQIESKRLREQTEMLRKILEDYQSELPAGSNLKDRLDGLHR